MPTIFFEILLLHTTKSLNANDEEIALSKNQKKPKKDAPFFYLDKGVAAVALKPSHSHLDHEPGDTCMYPCVVRVCVGGIAKFNVVCVYQMHVSRL